MNRPAAIRIPTLALWTFLFCVLAFFGALRPASAAETIRIGSVLSLTGPAAYLGDPELKTLQLYIDQINQKGGVDGRRLEFINYDDGSDANKANSFAKRLIESDKVNLLIAGTTTGASMAMHPLADRAKLPLISMAGGVPIIEPVKKWMFKTPQTDRMAAEKIFEDMKQRGLTKIGLLSETSSFGQSGRKESKVAAAKYGITLVADETFGAKDTDKTAQLTKLRGIPGIQAIFVFGLGQGPVIVSKNYAQLGIKLPQYQSHGVASTEYIRLAGPAAEGVRVASPALLVADALPANDPQKPVALAYIKDYQARYKAEPSTFGGYAHDALFLALDAIRRAGGTDPEKVRSALEQTKNFVGVTGTFNMSATDHMGLGLDAFRLLEVKNGDWTIVR